MQTADVEEARKLKQIHVNAALLKEQLMSAKAHADRAEASLAEIADIQVRLKELELELQAWRDMVGRIPGVEGRDDVLRKLRELQRWEILLLLPLCWNLGITTSTGTKISWMGLSESQMIEPGLMEQWFRLGTIFLWWADMCSVPARIFLRSLQPLACASVLIVLLWLTANWWLSGRRCQQWQKLGRWLHKWRNSRQLLRKLRVRGRRLWLMELHCRRRPQKPCLRLRGLSLR